MIYLNFLIIISIFSSVLLDQEGIEKRYKFTRKHSFPNTITPTRSPYSRNNRLNFTFPIRRSKVTWVPAYTRGTFKHQRTGITKLPWTGARSTLKSIKTNFKEYPLFSKDGNIQNYPNKDWNQKNDFEWHIYKSNDNNFENDNGRFQH